MAAPSLPPIAFYGDDFTGTTDALEALALAGLRARMFLQAPDLPHAADLHAVGLAGSARAMSPANMDRHLPAIFSALRDALPPAGGIAHYKLCSTFDSSPTLGSIGHAIEIGRSIFGPTVIPLIVAAPKLGRYCCFGNLFARSGGDSDVYRLDRHPTMSRHPVTPMDEADLRRHLARQTDLPIGLIDFRTLDNPATPNPLLSPTAPILLIDTLTDTHLTRIGAWLAEAARHRKLLVFGSSGVEYALTAWALATARLPPPPPPPAAPEVPVLPVVSGSCSPVTARQIDRALAAGYIDLPLSPDDLLDTPERPAATAARHLANGKSVILHTARGPDDPRIPDVRHRLAALPGQPGEVLGRQLGQILHQLLTLTRLPRALVTGGDTSFFVADQLGLHALDFLAPMAPGSPLCRVTAGQHTGLDIVFKGGQVGRDHFFETVRRGH